MNKNTENISTPRISIVMSTYNRAELLREALDSMICLDPPTYEIVVIDDGSCDHTAEVLQEYSAHIVFEQRKNAGKSSAINHAVNLATGDWIWVCDDDDQVLNSAIGRFTEGIRADSNAEFIYSGLGWLVKNDYGKYERQFPPTLDLPNADEIKACLLAGLWIPSLCSIIMRRELFLRIGGLREDLRRVEDEDFALRMVRAGTGYPVIDWTYLVRQHDGIRGAGVFQFSNETREAVDIDFLMSIYTDVYKNFPLTDYFCNPSNKFRLPSNPVLLRMLTMFRVCLWENTKIDYLHQRSNEFSTEELSNFTYHIALAVNGFTLQKQNDLFASALMATLKKTTYRDTLKKSLIEGIFKGLNWSVINKLKAKRENGIVKQIKMLLLILKIRFF